MVRSEGVSKTLLSMALTGSFITYGTGQIISGIYGDRISPKKLVFMGLSITTLMNLMIPICTNPYQMAAVWCVNGFAQSFMWPPLVKMMLMTLSDEEYSFAALVVPCGGSAGSVLVYLISPLLIKLIGWRAVFVFSAACGLIMAFLWNLLCTDITPEAVNASEKEKTSSEGKIITPILFAVMLAIVFQGMLRDGVTTWMPSYVSDVFKLGSETAILTGVLLPLFAIAFSSITSAIHKKFIKHPLVCAGTIFALGSVSAGSIYLLADTSPVISVVMFAILTGCMHGINLLLVCILPSYFKKFGKVSTVSGLLNSCTYVGSAISTYGIALMSESFGWSATVFLWIIVAFFGAMITFLSAVPWSRAYGKK